MKSETFFQRLLIAVMVCFVSVAFAQADHAVIFKVNRDQVIFNNKTVESVTFDQPQKNVDRYNLSVKLKAAGAQQLKNLTANNIGKKAQLIINGEIISTATIQSELGDDFLIPDLTKKQVDAFLKDLKKDAP